MGNRQGGKMTPRHDLSYQQKPRKQAGKQSRFNVNVDRLSPELRAVLQSMDGGCAGSLVTSPISALHTQVGHEHTIHSSPNFVGRVGQEKHMMSCVPSDQAPKDVRDEITTVAGGNSSQRVFHPPFHGNRNILKDSKLQNHQDFSKNESMVSNVFCSSYSSIPFLKHHCLESDPLSRVTAGVTSSTAVTNLAAACIQRLEHLKKNIEQCNTENLTHFNNAGFAQLQCEAGYGDYDNADVSKASETCEHGNGKRMSQTTAVMTGVPHLDDSARSKAFRKLSEPGQSVVRKDSMSSKTIIPSMWSKSAENSPVIVRKALPSPGSPLIVQRTPSQSPSVERRFPANVSPSSTVPWHATESLDSQQSRQHMCQQLQSRDASLNIRQKTAAEIFLSHISASPTSFRKMPESPVLRSCGIHHQRKHTGKEPASNSTKGDRSVADLTLAQKTCKVHCLKALTLSSCSSSSSECPLPTLSSLEDSVSPSIPPCTSSTSSPSITLSSSSPSPITFCPQPKGTPIRTCTMMSQPSTAVFLTSRDSQECRQIKNESMPSIKDTEIGGEGGKDTHEIITSSHKQPSSSVVTEDTIKQNSQSAVFGSVSPKLLRHRRLMKENFNPSHSKHTFPKQSPSINIMTSKTFPSKRENMVLGTGNSASIGSSDQALINRAGLSAQLSKSAPSAFSSQASDTSASCAGNKTLGQRIREVINEATSGASVTRETSSWIKTNTKTFSKDDIFTSTSTSEKISWYSFSNNYINRSQKLKYEKRGPPSNEKHIQFTTKRHEGNIEEDHRLKLTPSGADTKDIKEDIYLAKSTGHSYHYNSSRDSCSSCLSDSSQMDYYDGAGCQGAVGELTQANVCHQMALLSGGTHCRQQEGRGTQLGEADRCLATSDTSDTLSTDRDTSGSSKRESSTSTATDDTLTSFKTRSTADSVDYEEDFVLPKSLVFIRSADREAHNDMCGGFESEQTTIKRKLVHGQSYSVRAEDEPLSQKTRKKRRKQVNVQSQIVIARRNHTEDTLTRNRAVRQVHSEAISDDSDLFGSKEDISDLLGSRDNISDLPSSRDDISDLPSSRDDVSDLPSSRDDISDLPSSRDDISVCTRKVIGGCVNSGVVKKLVFHRSDLQSSTPLMGDPVDYCWSMIRQPATDDHSFIALSDSDTHCTFNRRGISSQDSFESFLDVSQMPDNIEISGTVLSKYHDQNGKQSEHTYPEELLQTHSVTSCTHKRLTAASHTGTILAEDDEDQHKSCQRALQANVGTDKGKQFLLHGPQSPESKSAVVLSCTIYNSTCHNIHDGK